MCWNHDIPVRFPHSCTLNYAGILISAYYFLRTFFNALFRSPRTVLQKIVYDSRPNLPVFNFFPLSRFQNSWIYAISRKLDLLRNLSGNYEILSISDFCYLRPK